MDRVDGWTPTTEVWQAGPVTTGRPEVICHNDTAPWNLIAANGAVVAFVDWDTAAPGNLEPMGWPAAFRSSAAERMTALREGYGCTPAQWDELLATIPARVSAAYDTMRVWAAEGRPGWAEQWNQPEPWRHGAGYLRDLEFLRNHRSVFT